VKNPLGADLSSVVQPIRNSAVKPPTAAPVRVASAEMMEASTGAVPNQLPEVMTARPHYYYDADDRGPSEISRELR